MFKSDAVCPVNGGTLVIDIPHSGAGCSGHNNKDGVLCNQCTMCARYKKFVASRYHFKH